MNADKESPAAQPLVSVIVPAYNVERFIAQAIRSVIRQTEPRWELFVVDDGSTDGTGDVVRRFRDARIRSIRTENRGPAAARNLALSQARGEFVAFLDPDDFWFPEKLAFQLEVMRDEPEVGLTYCNVVRVTEDGRRLRVARYPLSQLPDGSAVARMLVNNSLPAGGSTVLMRRTVLDRIGRFDETLQVAEDWDLWLRAALVADFRWQALPLAAYRMRRGSQSTKLEVANRCCRTVLSRAFSNPEVRRRFTGAQLGGLRREAEAILLFYSGKRDLRVGEVSRAFGKFRRSLAGRFFDVQQVVMLLLALVAVLPFVRRYWLRITGRD